VGLFKSKNLTAAQRTHQKWLSKYIKLRDADMDGNCTCCTCGEVKRYDDRTMHAGHCFRADMEGVVSNEFNVHVQCAYCNTYGDGRPAFHADFIVQQHGQDVFNELLTLAKEGITFKDYDERKEWYMERARYWKKQYEELKEIKDVE